MAAAKGYLSKDSSVSDLSNAMRLSPIQKGRTEEGLTPREQEVLSFLARGCTNKEIAQNLFISEKTVKTHLASIFRKLKVNRRFGAILYAINQGLS